MSDSIMAYQLGKECRLYIYGFCFCNFTGQFRFVALDKIFFVNVLGRKASLDKLARELTRTFDVSPFLQQTVLL